MCKGNAYAGAGKGVAVAIHWAGLAGTAIKAETEASMTSKSDLQKANCLFHEDNFKKAQAMYIDAMRKNIKLASRLEINVLICQKRIDPSFRFEESKAFMNKLLKSNKIESDKRLTLEKPEGLDADHFEKIKNSGLFDPMYYMENYSNAIGSAKNLLEHYLTKGIEKKFNPSRKFDTSWYIKANPDVIEAGVNPFIHYVCSGHKENRHPVCKLYQSRYEVAPAEYVPRLPENTPPPTQIVKTISFYLPQFHPIRENDEWWGEGFTEWTNVKPAVPQFEGHYQPHIPHKDIGYYSLLDRKTQSKQIELAKQYGIGGFCYYLYWFSGRRLLEQPLDNMLKDPTLDFPFCVCWANENWTRRWDGLDQDLLMVQNYSEADDFEFIQNTAKYLTDPRYIKIDDKPLLLIYRPNLFPDIKASAMRWRQWCRNNGIGEIYLAYPQAFESIDPAIYDFDAALEFPPNKSEPPDITEVVTPVVKDFQSKVYDWRIFLERSDEYTDPSYTLFRSVTPMWDNTARKKNRGVIFHNSCPQLFKKNLVNAFAETIRAHDNPKERLVFINAWNEWAEGAHLEPDQRYGYAWLQSVYDSHNQIKTAAGKKVAIVIHAYYKEILEEILSDLNWVKSANARIYITTPVEKFNDIKKIASKYEYQVNMNAFANRGRDILPFLKVLPKVLRDKNQYILKIHTKKSLHRHDGDKWRRELYEELLSMGMFVRSINMFEQDKKLSMISPDGNLVPISYYWGSNEKNVLKLCKEYEIGFNESKKYRFIAGSMFMARASFFENLLKSKKIVDNEFDDESGQVDGTLAHAYERFFGIFSKEKKWKTALIKNTAKKFGYAENNK